MRTQASALSVPVLTLAQLAERYRESRVDVRPGTLRILGVHLEALKATFGERDPHTLSVADVTDWIAASKLKPSSLRCYFQTLRAILDFDGVEPNPARDQRIRLPRHEPLEISPPSASEVAAIIAHVPDRYRLLLRLLEQTGMRVSEAVELEWQDVDLAGCRLRLRGGKTRAARRWVAVPEWLMRELDALCPPDDRTPERRLFDVTRNAVGSAMRRGFTAAGPSAAGLRRRAD